MSRYPRWTDAELETLTTLAAKSMTPAQIARQLPGRSAVSVYTKLRKPPPPPPPPDNQVRVPAATSALDTFLRKPPPGPVPRRPRPQ